MYMCACSTLLNQINNLVNIKCIIKTSQHSSKELYMKTILRNMHVYEIYILNQTTNNLNEHKRNRTPNITLLKLTNIRTILKNFI
jgi:uncharacterized protein with HEPN domain